MFPTTSSERESYILSALRDARASARWARVTSGPVEFDVMTDALKVDGLRVIAGARVATLALDVLDAVLPTPKMVDLAMAAAPVRVAPKPRPISRETSAVVAHSRTIDEVLRTMNAPDDAFIDNAGKWWVVCNALTIAHDRAANYGWVVPTVDAAGNWSGIKTHASVSGGARVVQPLATAHNAEHDDYSQTIRGVRRVCRVNGEERDIREVWFDPSLARFVSHEGVLLVMRQPGVPVSGEIVLPELVIEASPPTPRAVPTPQTRPAMSAVQQGDELGVAFVRARNFTSGRRKTIRLLVVHTAECGEVANAAENLASWCAGANAPRASWHYAVDSTSATQSVREGDTAWHAPGVNSESIGVEHAGRAAQDANGWSDAYSVALLERSARLVANVCKRHAIPIRKLTPAEVLNGERGICGHVDVTRAFPSQGSHTDPGPAFPWQRYLDLVRAAE